MTHADTAKSRHATRILDKTGVSEEFEKIVWWCASDAFGTACYDYEFETYQKSGTHHFLHHRFPIGAQSEGILIEGEAEECVKHFKNGVMARVLYEFDRHNGLTLKFILRDSYVHGEFGEFNLYAIIKFEDFRDYYDYEVSAYTLPLFDSEESVSKTMFWHELNS